MPGGGSRIPVAAADGGMANFMILGAGLGMGNGRKR